MSKELFLFLGGSFENLFFELLASLSKHPMIVDILCVDSFDYLQLLTFSEWPKTLQMTIPIPQCIVRCSLSWRRTCNICFGVPFFEQIYDRGLIKQKPFFACAKTETYLIDIVTETFMFWSNIETKERKYRMVTNEWTPP